MAERVALYARVSTDVQAKRQLSVPVQLSEMRLFCKEHHWQVVAEYRDEGYSGTSIHRPQFALMIQDAEAGKFDRIVVHAVDRFGRSKADAAIKETLSQTHGVRFAYVMENITGDDDRELEVGFKELIAQDFSKRLAQRVSKGQREAVRQGRMGYGGFAPYGYRIKWIQDGTRPQKTLAPDAETAPIVREMFKRYAKGESIRAIQRWLNESAIPTPAALRGAKPRGRSHGLWLEGTIFRILRNPVYLGDLAVGRHRQLKSKNGKATRRYRPPEEWVTFRDHHEALIDRKIFETARKHGERNKQFRAGPNHPGNLLSDGIGRCKGCGGTVTIERNGYRWYFYCRNFRRILSTKKAARDSYRATCSGCVQLDDVLKALHTKVALCLSMRPEAIDKAIRAFNRRSRGGTEPQELISARATLTRVERREQRLLQAVDIGGDDIPALVNSLRDVQEDKEHWQERISQLEAEHRVTFKPIDEIEFDRSAKQILQRLKKSGELPKDLLRAVIARVDLDMCPTIVYRKRENLRKRLVAFGALPGTSARDRYLAYKLVSRIPTPRIRVIPRFDADKETELTRINGQPIMIPTFAFEAEGLPESIVSVLRETGAPEAARGSHSVKGPASTKRKAQRTGSQ